VTTAAAAASWLAVNLPYAIADLPGWWGFYRNLLTGLAGYSSVWYYIHEEVWHYSPATEMSLILVLTVVAFALIGWLVLAAPRRPRVPQVLFLTLAAYLLLAEVFEPEYVIWLVPLVALARPRLWAWVLWQTAEAAFLFAYWPEQISEIFQPAPGGIQQWLYFTALMVRILTIVLLCAMVVRDILRPEADLVRRDGEDDPAGGVLDGAPDKITLRLATRWRPRLTIQENPG
jgi:uncharacterized membrane protein